MQGMLKAQRLGLLRMQLHLCIQTSLAVSAALSITSISCTASLTRWQVQEASKTITQACTGFFQELKLSFASRRALGLAPVKPADAKMPTSAKPDDTARAGDENTPAKKIVE